MKIFTRHAQVSFKLTGDRPAVETEVFACKNTTEMDRLARTIHAIRKPDLVIFGYEPAKLLQDFIACHRMEKAAGGIVGNREGKLLAIFRKGMWDLPKGKMENGEPAEAAALREVWEETGITAVIASPAGETYHTYLDVSGVPVLKVTRWFRMNYVSGVPSPQTVEEISEVRWFTPAGFRALGEGTFPSMKDLFLES